MAYGQTEKLNSIGHQYKLILFLFLSGLAEGKHLISLTRGAVYKVSPLQATSINVLQDIEQREQKDVAEKLGVLEKELKVGEAEGQFDINDDDEESKNIKERLKNKELSIYKTEE